jgi:hypothetical protein
MATPTGKMRGGIQNLNLFRAIRTHEMCPLAACWTCYPRDLNMALAMTTQMKGFNAFFQETGASKLANAERGCLLDGPSLCHPTTQIFWLALPTVNSASAAGSADLRKRYHAAKHGSQCRARLASL